VGKFYEVDDSTDGRRGLLGSAQPCAKSAVLRRLYL